MSKTLKHFIKNNLWLAFFMLLQACGNSAPNKLMIQYETSALINPDLNVRPSPLVINSYQLSAPDAFQSADFFSLYNNPKTALGSELIYQEQIEVKPNEVFKTEQDYFHQTKYLGFVAAFRDIDHAVWKKIMAVKSKEENPICVLLGPKEMQIQE